MARIVWAPARLMQGLSDGYFVLPYTVGDYIAKSKLEKIDTGHAEFAKARAAVSDLTQTPAFDQGNRRRWIRFIASLARSLWDYCGMSRNAQRACELALGQIRELREEYWKDVTVSGSADDLNQSLEKAGRVADFFELAELMCLDALERNESCGGHFREEYQTPEGEAQRNDEEFSYAAAWEYQGPDSPPVLNKEPLKFEYVQPSAAELQVMRLTLHVWRQKNPARGAGWCATMPSDVNPDMSILEMLDVINEDLILKGEEPIAFEHDCREGICGSCGFMINGVAHGPLPATTVCQLTCATSRTARNCIIEPWRAKAFPVIKDLVVDRSAFDRIISAGGFITVPTGSAPDGNAIPVPKEDADRAMDAAACIGCGACVAACPNASAALFTGAKISHLGLLPQGQPERHERALRMVAQFNA